MYRALGRLKPGLYQTGVRFSASRAREQPVEFTYRFCAGGFRLSLLKIIAFFTRAGPLLGAERAGPERGVCPPPPVSLGSWAM